jgi:hypothetical protein
MSGQLLRSTGLGRTRANIRPGKPHLQYAEIHYDHPNGTCLTPHIFQENSQN